MLMRRYTMKGSCPVLRLATAPRRPLGIATDATVNPQSGSADQEAGSTRDNVTPFYRHFRNIDKLFARQPTMQELFKDAKELTSSATGFREMPRGATSSSQLFPNTRSLFPDVRTSQLLCESSSTLRTSEAVEAKGFMTEKGGSDSADTCTSPKHVNHHQYQEYPCDTSSRIILPRLQDTHKTSDAAEIAATRSGDAELYAFAYEFWQQRSKELMERQRDMQQLVSGSQYMHDLQQKDMREGVINTIRLSVFVMFPFVLLVSLFLFNESVVYSAALNDIRLVDYDAWCRKITEGGGRAQLPCKGR